MKKRIMILDDDEGIQDLMRIIFEKYGYIVNIAPDGDFIFSGKYELPDIFLLDRQLLGTDGLNICRYLKKSPETAVIPVILISAAADIKILSDSAGADGYLEKPFNIDDLLNTINLHLIKKEKATGEQ